VRRERRDLRRSAGHLFGAEVAAVCSTSNVDMACSLGADHVIDYTRDDFAEGEERYDAILDIGGNPSLSRLRRALAAKATLVIVGGETGGRWLGRTDRQLGALLVSNPGKITPVIDRTYPLTEVAQAIRYLEQGHARGKVVITV
jgi:NADPH:quinone reductase-like Zn-dependent oxidoreductase